MNDLIKVTINEKNEQLVSARELHEFLEVNERYNDWFPRMKGYGFEENTDFITFTEKKVTGGRPLIDHIIKLEMAKEIAMLSKTEKGKQARKYFIECEKQLNKQLTKTEEETLDEMFPGTNEYLLMLVGNSVRENKTMRVLLKEQAPKVEFYDKVVKSESLLTMQEAANLINETKLGRTNLYEFLRTKEIILKDSNTPKRIYLELGYFKQLETSYEYNGKIRIGLKTMVTQKGLIWLIKLVSKPQLKLQEPCFASKQLRLN